MNKTILAVAIFLISCTQIPTRTVLDCSDNKGCSYQKVQIAPKAVPIQAPAELVN